MRKVGPKNAIAIRSIATSKQRFRDEFGGCMNCGSTVGRLDVHELLRGQWRGKSKLRRECWLLLCEVCHPTIQDQPLAVQLLLKLENDPLWFDLDVVREIRDTGRKPVVVTMADIRNATLGRASA